MALKDAKATEVSLQFANMYNESSYPAGCYFILPTKRGEPYAIPVQTQLATLELNLSPERNQALFQQIVSVLKETEAPFSLPTQPDQPTESHAILVHGASLTKNSLQLLVSAQPGIFSDGSIEVYF